MPTPTQGETWDEFEQRCIPEVIRDGTARSGAQAVAVCRSLFERGPDNKNEEGE